MVQNYYYIIVGGGLAGLQLALKLSKDIFFKGKSIAIIDPDPKEKNDKTWCFWEKGNGHWDHLVTHEWSRGKFISKDIDHNFELSPYYYKMLKSIDFYTYIKQELEKSEEITFIKDEIQEIDPVTRKATGDKGEYTATHFFDSRVTSGYLETEKHSRIYQHFKGRLIETEKPVFNSSEFTMMDFRLKYKDSTSFTYILPLSRTKALVEYTFFTPFLTEEKIYDELLDEYISKYLKPGKYETLSTESGIIPMTDFPFESGNTTKITKIGTGGGWVKASTGYSFKNTEKKIEKIVDNIKSGVSPGSNLINYKFRRYDRIFLDVLYRNNELGEEIFTKFYTKNSPEEIFAYLDEESSFSEDLKIMLSLYNFQFIKSFLRKGF
ncbi:lycopene cyclase family protein [Salegentibacter chungangensis]|uniref:Lycopene cyclase family protein n=1 Tax=Salegentibacter chungangensis TaxID=1335724 RepID=A0ABW3NUL2_9FLAO